VPTPAKKAVEPVAEKNLLKEAPGKIDFLAQRELEHPLPVATIFTETEAKVLAEKPLVQREGCLSIPDLTANVIRADRIQLKALDRAGNPWSRTLDGFEAIAAQHEVDHLDAKLFLDRVVNLKTDLFRRKTYS
jgi:peptide deformylase